MEIIKDAGTGKISLMRLLTAYIVVVVTGVWAWLSIKEGVMLSVDIEQIMLVIGALGVKAAQRGIERKGE